MSLQNSKIWFTVAGIVGILFGIFYALFGLAGFPAYRELIPKEVIIPWSNGLYGSIFIGNNNAPNITIGGGSTVATSITSTTTTIVGALVQNSGSFSLTGNAASSITTSTGALTITSAAASTWSTSTGGLIIDGFSGIDLKVSGQQYINLNPTITLSSGLADVGSVAYPNITFLKEIDHAITIATSTTLNANGGNLTIKAGDGDGTGDGGDLLLIAGVGSPNGNVTIGDGNTPTLAFAANNSAMTSTSDTLDMDATTTMD